MPPRLIAKSKDSLRPLSAIYIGNQSHASNNNNNNAHASTGPISAAVGSSSPIPDLPEPPSPVSSTGSGLPSPPATNSTGSGSTGDPASIAVRRPMSTAQSAQSNNATTLTPHTRPHPHTSNSDSSSTVLSSSRSSSRLSSKGGERYGPEENDQDEDQTMRLRAGVPPPESPLQRARSLIQRSKLQLDMMASGRLATTTSPTPTSSSRINRHSIQDASQGLSGSETEREGDSVVFHSTSTTSSSSKSRTSDSSANRQRHYSAPTSPQRARHAVNNGGTQSPNRRRKRVSLASSHSYDDDHSDDEHDNYEHRSTERYEIGTARDRIRDRQDTLRDDRDSTKPPAVNLNSIRKTPLPGARRRSALPREFREGSADEYSNSINSDLPPQTPYRPHSNAPSTSMSTATTSTAPPSASTLGRRSTLRGGRGFSDDYRDYRNSPTYSLRDLPSSSSTRARNTPSYTLSNPPGSAPSKSTHIIDNSRALTRTNTIGRQTHVGTAPRERRQSLRGGSAESALSGNGRSLVGEGLRAAGLSRRVGIGTRDKERERTLGESADGKKRPGSVASGGGGGGGGDLVSDETSGHNGEGDVFRETQRRVEWSPEATESVMRQRRVFDELGVRTVPPRASTSMADYSYTSRNRHQTLSDDEDGEGEGGREDRRLRGHRSARPPVTSSREASLTRTEHSLLDRERDLRRREREVERASSVLGRYHTGGTVPSTPASTTYSTIHDRDRYAGSFGSTRRNLPSSAQVQQQPQVPSEHTRLMVDSLSMFEAQLAKLMPSPANGPNHIEMLSRNAQALVLSAERLNGMLRTGNSRALDAQIEAEVEGDFNGPGTGGAKSLLEVWRKIGGDYREGLRVSDELVRAVTGLLLGVGRVVKEYAHSTSSAPHENIVGTPRGVGGSPILHARSVSLCEDLLGSRGSLSPDLGGGGGGGGGPASTGSGGGSSGLREPRRSLDPRGSAGGSTGGKGGGGSSNASVSTGIGSREEALRRLAGVRSDSPLARASPAFQAVRELDRLETGSPAFGGGGLGLPKVNIPGARRLFAPSQQREMALVASAEDGAQNINYDPSPTPHSRTRVFDRAELGVPLSQQRSPVQQLQQLGEAGLQRRKTLMASDVVTQPGIASETSLRRNVTVSGTRPKPDAGPTSATLRDRQERRKVSVTSITTVRASNGNASTTTGTISSPGSVNGVGVPGFPTLTTPSGTTTAVTLDGVSIGVMRSESDGSSGARGTFSRPEGVSSISGLQQQLEGYRKRAENESAMDGAGTSDEGKGKSASASMAVPELEREMRRKTFGTRIGTRISLDGAMFDGGAVDVDGSGRRVVDLSVNAADRSAAATAGGVSAATVGGRKERRRTVTDIWPAS